MTRAPGALAATAARLANASASLRVEDLREAAQAAGVEVGAIACQRLRARYVEDRRTREAREAAQAWRAMPEEVAALLLTMACPEIEAPAYVARQPWAALTEDQRGAVGAYARFLRDSLQGAQCLKR